MTVIAHERLGRNDPCPCGSGKKYKQCHLDQDRAAEASEREQSVLERHPDHCCERYKPQTHKVAAVSRPDFVVTVRNLAATGEESWLHVASPSDLGRDQASVDAALAFLKKHAVAVDFDRDPPPPVITAVGDLLDRMCGRGVFKVLASGARLRRYGRSEIVRADDGPGYVAYLGGREPDAVVSMIIDAVTRDGEALGIEGGLPAHMWPVARVLRELVVDHLALPKDLDGTPLVTALVERIDRETSPRDESSRDFGQAAAAIIYRVALREAVEDPCRHLEGMGLGPNALELVANRLETAGKAPAWALQLADLAGDEWETAEGYNAWVAAAREVADVADMLDRWLATDDLATVPQPCDTGDAKRARPAASPLAAEPELTQAAAEKRDGMVTAPQAMEQVAMANANQEPTAGLAPGSLFADLDVVAEEYALHREVIHTHLGSILDRSEANARRQRELSDEATRLAAEAEAIQAEQSAATRELEELSEEESRSHVDSLIAALGRGCTALDEVGAAWSTAISPTEGRDVGLAAAQRQVREYEEMERNGILRQLPPGFRGDLEQRVLRARETIREALGGRDPLVLPVVVAASEEGGVFSLTLGLPLRGVDELVPGALQTAVAASIADVVAEVIRSMPEIEVAGVDHVVRDAGASLLRVRLSGPPDVEPELCAEYCAGLLGAADQKSPALREAAVSFDVRVEPELELED